MEYKDTLNLPKTSFPMKADLPVREPKIYAQWESSDLYGKIQAREAPLFVLHDGPPYANGDIHIGHALNKILKDIIIRYKTMRGFRTPYVPGWDCHGLPVELQLFKELGKTKHEVDRLEFREKAGAYALRYVNIQKEQFKRLGIMGDWDRPYLTMNHDYQAMIISCFWKLYKKGFIYKGLKPIHWCTSCETALAEAEVEYETRRSPSIYVKFPLTNESCARLDIPENTSIVVWTTTPWTLPANVAIALHPQAVYSVLKINGDDLLVVASDLVGKIQTEMGWSELKELKRIEGKKFDRLEYHHPFMERTSILILGSHVTLDQGTGCVHTAPGHGQEDYEVSLSYQLPILSPVNARGVFTDEVKLFEKQFVFKANHNICNLLNGKGFLLGRTEIEHSYPHCWRCRSAIIFRATQQWFIGVDRNDLRKKAMEAIETISWIPPGGKNRISSMLQSRPDWCLSRQRLWGVPIPVFYCNHCGKEFLDDETLEEVIQRIRTHGASIWFKQAPNELMGGGKKCISCGGLEFSKEEDIIDVWFDSGVSHQAVLGTRDDLGYPADLYLEGSDQHRGWFQTSLLTAVGLKDQAPFKAVLTHGFVVDGEGKKMSKSAGNVVAPQEVMKKYGADILRLWVSSTDFSQDVRISETILAQIADTYRKIRNTFRYLLGNLYDYDKMNHAHTRDNLFEIDRWILSRLANIYDLVCDAYERYDYCKIYHVIDQFCTVDLSSFYFDILKDRLYTSAASSKARRAAQGVLYEILRVLDGILAPILPFTTEEVWQADHLLGSIDSSVHLSEWPEISLEYRSPDLESKWETIQAVRTEVLRVVEGLRKQKKVGSALEASVKLVTNNQEVLTALSGLGDELKSIFIVSHASVEEDQPPWPKGCEEAQNVRGLGIGVELEQGKKCQRCWNYSPTVGRDGEHPLICERCIEAIQA